MDDIFDKMDLSFLEIKSNINLVGQEQDFNNPASDSVLKEAKSLAFSLEDLDFFKETNGYHLNWKSVRSTSLNGKIHILKLEEILDNKANELISEFNYNNKDIKKYYPIDIFSDEAHCGTLANEQGSSRMYYHSYGDDELFDLMVDFKGYLNLAIEAKGFFYWPKYLLEHHYSKQSEESSNFKKEMPLLFPKFKIEEFNRLIDQNILK